MIASFLFEKKIKEIQKNNQKSGCFGGCQAARGGKGVMVSFRSPRHLFDFSPLTLWVFKLLEPAKGGKGVVASFLLHK